MVIFQLVLLAGGLCGLLQPQMFRAVDLGWLDNLGRGVVGTGAALFVHALIALPVASYAPPATDAVAGWVLVPVVDRAADSLSLLVPAGLRAVYLAGMSKARKRWDECPTARELDAVPWGPGLSAPAVPSPPLSRSCVGSGSPTRRWFSYLCATSSTGPAYLHRGTDRLYVSLEDRCPALTVWSSPRPASGACPAIRTRCRSASARRRAPVERSFHHVERGDLLLVVSPRLAVVVDRLYRDASGARHALSVSARFPPLAGPVVAQGKRYGFCPRGGVLGPDSACRCTFLAGAVLVARARSLLVLLGFWRDSCPTHTHNGRPSIGSAAGRRFRPVDELIACATSWRRRSRRVRPAS